MLEQSLVEKAREKVAELNEVCDSYVNLKAQYVVLIEKKGVLEREKKEVEDKEKKEDKFLEVVLLAKRKTTEIDEVSKKLQMTRAQLDSVSRSLNDTRTDILKRFEELPFPIDPHSSSVDGSVTKFKTIEGIAFGEGTLRTLCELMDLQYPLEFEGTTFHPEEAIVKTTSVDEAMNQVVQSVQALRFKIGDLLSAYSNIDKLVERIKSSNRYSPILQSLFMNNKPLSVTEIAKQTGFNENIAYQACYNMLRDRWSPNPIKKTPNGNFALTTTGEITMKRYAEKYGLSLSLTQKKLDEGLELSKQPTNEPETEG